MWWFTRPFPSNVKISWTGQYSIHTNIHFRCWFPLFKIYIMQISVPQRFMQFFLQCLSFMCFFLNQCTWNDDKATTWSRETSMYWLFVVLCFDCTAKTTCEKEYIKREMRNEWAVKNRVCVRWRLVELRTLEWCNVGGDVPTGRADNWITCDYLRPRVE